jgi:hypothetical protein
VGIFKITISSKPSRYLEQGLPPKHFEEFPSRDDLLLIVIMKKYPLLLQWIENEKNSIKYAYNI